MISFLAFCEQKRKELFEEAEKKRTYRISLQYIQQNNNVTEWYKEWQQGVHEEEEKGLTVTETTYGLATNIKICCKGCNGILAKSEAMRTKNCAATKSDLYRYDINLQLCFALQLTGVGGEHAAIFASFLDLPDPHKWIRQFNVTENFCYEPVQKVKEYSQTKAVQAEILATISQEGNAVEQNMLELDRPIRCVQASYDMGWQVRSSGGRYASPTGHAMFIRALKKRVLDSIEYNKKSGVCTRHYSLYNTNDNMKTHNVFIIMMEHLRRWKQRG